MQRDKNLWRRSFAHQFEDMACALKWLFVSEGLHMTGDLHPDSFTYHINNLSRLTVVAGEPKPIETPQMYCCTQDKAEAPF